MEKVCEVYKGGCSHISPCQTRTVHLPDGRVGYCPVSCDSEVPCGFYPIWDREQFKRFFGEEPYPGDI